MSKSKVSKKVNFIELEEPKRPLTAFAAFVREELSKEKGKSAAQLMPEIAKKFGKLSEAQKKKLQEDREKKLQEYEKNMKEFLKKCMELGVSPAELKRKNYAPLSSVRVQEFLNDNAVHLKFTKSALKLMGKYAMCLCMYIPSEVKSNRLERAEEPEDQPNEDATQLQKNRAHLKEARQELKGIHNKISLEEVYLFVKESKRLTNIAKNSNLDKKYEEIKKKEKPKSEKKAKSEKKKGDKDKEKEKEKKKNNK